MNSGLINQLILSLMIAFQSCQDSRLYPGDEASEVYLREVAGSVLAIGHSIRTFQREVEALPDSVETLAQRGYLKLDPELNSDWIWTLEVNRNEHLIIHALSKATAPVGKDLELIYDYTREKWLRPYKIR